MNFFHPILSRASLVASASVNPLSLQSSSIQSSHLFLGRPLPLFSSILPYIATYGNLSALILSTCSNYFNLCVCIFPTKPSLSRQSKNNISVSNMLSLANTHYSAQACHLENLQTACIFYFKCPCFCIIQHYTSNQYIVHFQFSFARNLS